MIDDGYPIVTKFKAEPGAKAGALTLIKKTREDAHGHSFWECECACGGKGEFRRDRLSAGARGKNGGARSCGCKQAKVFKAANRDGHVITRRTTTNGGCEIIKPTSYRDYNRGIVYLVKCPKCGRLFLDTIKSTSDNCGCVTGNFKTLESRNFFEKQEHYYYSAGEQKIGELLTKINIPFETGKRWLNCADKNPLPFDFYLNSPRYGEYVIEFDGEQHFHDIPCFGGDFDLIRTHDLKKNRYCWANNIKMIRIPYDALDTMVLNDLSIVTTRFLLTPENEKEYYDSRNQYKGYKQ